MKGIDESRSGLATIIRPAVIKISKSLISMPHRQNSEEHSVWVHLLKGLSPSQTYFHNLGLGSVRKLNLLPDLGPKESLGEC